MNQPTDPRMSEAEEQEIKNAPDKLLMAGKANIGKRRATRLECMEELQRRILIRRKAVGL